MKLFALVKILQSKFVIKIIKLIAKFIKARFFVILHAKNILL